MPSGSHSRSFDLPNWLFLRCKSDLSLDPLEELDRASNLVSANLVQCGGDSEQSTWLLPFLLM